MTDPRLCPVLVGREDVLAVARRRWTTAAGGAGHVLFLAGEAGIGKTRSIREILAEVRAVGGRTVAAAAHPRDAETVGGLLAESAAALRRTGDAGFADAGELLADRLGSGASRHNATDLADAILRLASPARPALLVLEDLHWADSLTLDVLERVATGVPGTPLLILGSYRSDELFPSAPIRAWRARLLTQRLAEECRLPRLSPDQTAAMCAAMAGDAVPAALAGTLHLRSDGVPLHVEELFAAPGAVPETLADAVRARAGLLSDRARAIAGAAAVLGRRFDVDLLARVTGDPASIDGALRELGERFLVVEADEGLEFRHALIRDAIYADLPPLIRRSLHARSAKAAVAANLGDAAISAHYEQAHQPEPAYRHALAGAREAAAVSAHREAVELYRRAQRTAPAAVPAGQRAGLVAELAAALAAIDANDAAAAAYEEAARRYSELGRITDAAALAPALAAVRHLLGVGLEQRVELLRRALDDVPDENPDVRARILAALAAAYMLDRRLEAAFEAGVEASTLVTDPDQAGPECCWSGSFRCRRMLPGP